MNGRRRVLLNGLLLAVVIGSACSSWVAGAGLPPEIRTSGNAGAIRPQVDKFVNEQIALLTSDDPTAVTAARELIIAQAVQQTPTAPAPSALFLSAYADSLNTALGAGPAKDPNARVRLNAAIIAARVAEKANNMGLVPVVVVLLGDQNEGVVLWAAKASKYLLPSLLGNVAAAKGNTLMPALLAAAKRNLKSAAVITATYDALKVEEKGPNAVIAGAWPQVVPVVVDAIHSIMEQRIKLYDQGIPPGPSAEGGASAYLTTNRALWKDKAADPQRQTAQQLQTVQLVSDLISFAAQRLPASGSERTEMSVGLLRPAAGGLQVISEELGKDENVKKIYSFGASTPVADVITAADGVFLALKKLPQFSKLKPPPPLSAIPATSTTSESAAPTTVP